MKEFLKIAGLIFVGVIIMFFLFVVFIGAQLECFGAALNNL